MHNAVLFDLDETLFDRRGSLRLFLADQFSRFSLPTRWTPDDTIDRFLELDNRGRCPKQDVYRVVLAECGSEDNALAEELFDDYERNAWRFAQAFDGMESMFGALKATGTKTGIITNGQTHIQLRSLLALNLDRIVDTFLISETVGIRKPDPEIFLRAADALAVDPTSCIFVGDSPEADMVGAAKAGMKTIWFPNGAQWPTAVTEKPDAVINSLDEVVGLVRRQSPSRLDFLTGRRRKQALATDAPSPAVPAVA